MNDPIRIELYFQGTGFSEDEVSEFRTYFEDLGDVHAETYHQPAAGAAFGFAVIVKFVVAAVAGGVIYDVIKALSIRLSRMWERRKGAIEATAIQLRFSDVSVILGIDDQGRYSPDEYSVHQSVVERLSEIHERVADHLTSAPLNAADFKFLHVPVLADQEALSEPLIKRNWKISGDRYTRHGFGTYYDSTARLIFTIEDPTRPA